MGRWQEMDHTADLDAYVWGDNLRDLFATAARAMFALMATKESRMSDHVAVVRLDAGDIETLLVDWLNELLYLSETSRVVFSDFDFELLEVACLDSDVQLHAIARGGPPTEYLNYIKAATFHNLSVRRTAEGYETEIVFDV